MGLTLYKKDISPPCCSVFMTIHALKIPDVKFIEVSLQRGEHMTEEFLRMNPQHTVPVLIDDDFVIWDSHAICGYLVTKFGQTDSLYPTGPKKRAVIEQRLHFDNEVLFPILRAIVVPFMYFSKDFEEEDLAKIKGAYRFMENFLVATWLAGDTITIADICCVSTISSMHVIFPIDAGKFPKLFDWLERCSDQEFYKKGNAPNILLFRKLINSKLEEKANVNP